MVTGVSEFLHDWFYDYPYDNGQPIPNPLGAPSANDNGQNARGNVLALIPLYKGHVAGLGPNEAIEPVPQPAWVRNSGGLAIIVVRRSLN